VQVGFIVGTLGMAITGLADRFSRPVNVFAVAACLAQLSTVALCGPQWEPTLDVVMRFMTGFFAGPVFITLGMKL